VSVERQVERPEDPSSERWLQYYKEARVRRRARGPEIRSRTRLRRWRNRQRTLIISGFLTVGVLFGVFYALLER
jgi:hypothetical protein